MAARIPERRHAFLIALSTLLILSGCSLRPESGARADRADGNDAAPRNASSAGQATAGSGANQGGETDPTGYKDTRNRYKITGPGPLKAQPDGSATFSGEDERFVVEVVEGAKAADPTALAEADLNSLSKSTTDFKVVLRPAAVTLGGQRMIKFTYTSTGKSQGKSVKLTSVRYYIPKNDSMLAIVSYSDVSIEFSAQEADGFATSFGWL
jgi:hypothetical protein